MNDFIASLFELWGNAQFGDFSNDMFQEGEGSFYLQIFLIMVILTIVVPVLYYYVIDNARLNRWYYWLLFNFGTAIVNFIFSWVCSSESIANYYYQEQLECPSYGVVPYFTLSLIVAMWSMIFFFVVSLIIKWKSKNSCYSPF
ncbi:hypothetical protein J5690_07190 [bacterium]|nr:hypothetical protein [bacterium]